MAIVATLGKPDLFVTITCNPLWSEIADNLLPRHIWGDRLDLVCRVFRLKLKTILHDICKNSVLGKVIVAFTSLNFKNVASHMLIFW